MKYILSLFLVVAIALQSLGQHKLANALQSADQNQQIINDLKKNYKSVKVDGDFIMAVDKKSKENCAFLSDGTLLYKDLGSFVVKKDSVYDGMQHYMIKNAYSGIKLALVDRNGKTIVPRPESLEYIGNAHSKVFMNKTFMGPDHNRSYHNTEVYLPDGTLLFKSNLAEGLDPIYDDNNLFFIGRSSSGRQVYNRLIDSKGKVLLDLGDYISHYKLGGKYYFTTYRPIPGIKGLTSYSLVFDEAGKMLPGLRATDWYIELDGEVFFILQKYSTGFNGKVEKGDCFVYSPDYGEMMPWAKTDKALALRTENGKRMLVKTSESGAEEKLALSNVALAQNTPTAPKQQPAKAVVEKQSNHTKPAVKQTVNDIDNDIPKTSASHANTFALIIANENYRREEQVPYALNDGRIFAEYLRNTLGVPEKNIQLYTDASLNDIKYGINRLAQICDAFGSDASVIVYYAGHGVPDEKSLDAHLLPVDGYGSDASTGYSLNSLMESLSSLPAKQTVLLLDACFSGSQRSGKMMASNSRGVKLKPRSAEVGGKVVVLSATQGDETAYPFEGQDHGMFTYFLLKKLKESKGSVTLGELSDYIITNVKRASVINNEKIQTPTVKASEALTTSWRNLNFGE